MTDDTNFVIYLDFGGGGGGGGVHTSKMSTEVLVCLLAVTFVIC